MRQPREQQLQMIVELGHRAHCGARRSHRIGLVNRNRSGHAFYFVYLRLVHAIHELTGIGRESLYIAALAFGKKRVKHQT